MLYCFFVIEHQRRRILHFNVTPHPNAEWIIQQLREAFPEPCRYRYVLFDRNRKFNAEVLSFLEASGLEPKCTSVRAPWQKWPCGAMDRKLPAGDSGPYHCAE
jgi:hypothetical protein